LHRIAILYARSGDNRGYGDVQERWYKPDHLAGLDQECEREIARDIRRGGHSRRSGRGGRGGGRDGDDGRDGGRGRGGVRAPLPGEIPKVKPFDPRTDVASIIPFKCNKELRELLQNILPDDYGDIKLNSRNDGRDKGVDESHVLNGINTTIQHINRHGNEIRKLADDFSYYSDEEFIHHPLHEHKNIISNICNELDTITNNLRKELVVEGLETLESYERIYNEDGSISEITPCDYITSQGNNWRRRIVAGRILEP